MLDLIARHWEGARLSASRTYANTTEADADAWPLWLRGVWRTSAPGGITLDTIPAGLTAEVLLTISANWGDGMLEVPRYLEQVREIDPNAGATVFIATHTAKDWLDDDYFPTPGIYDARTLKITDAANAAMDLGAELGSESVSHTPRFAGIPLGSGKETWGSYAPLVKSRKRPPARRCSASSSSRVRCCASSSPTSRASAPRTCSRAVSSRRPRTRSATASTRRRRRASCRRRSRSTRRVSTTRASPTSSRSRSPSRTRRTAASASASTAPWPTRRPRSTTARRRRS